MCYTESSLILLYPEEGGFHFLKKSVEEGTKMHFGCFSGTVRGWPVLLVQLTRFLLSCKVFNRISCPVQVHRRQ